MTIEGSTESSPVLCSIFTLSVARPSLALGVHFDAALPDRAQHRLIVALVLLRIGSREIGHRFVELIAFAQIARDQGGLACPSVCPSQRPTAKVRVLAHHTEGEELDQQLDLHVMQLPDIEVAALTGLGPSEKQVAGRLTQPQTVHDPLAVICIDTLTDIGLQDGRSSLFDLEKQRVVD